MQVEWRDFYPQACKYPVASSVIFTDCVGRQSNLIKISSFLQYYDQPDDYEKMCNYFNAALTFLFAMEAALKLFAFKLV